MVDHSGTVHLNYSLDFDYVYQRSVYFIVLLVAFSVFVFEHIYLKLYFSPFPICIFSYFVSLIESQFNEIVEAK